MPNAAKRGRLMQTNSMLLFSLLVYENKWIENKIEQLRTTSVNSVYASKYNVMLIRKEKNKDTQK